MEQNIEPRNKPSYLWSTNSFFTKMLRIQNGERIVSSINFAEKMYVHMQKIKWESISITHRKINSKWISLETLKLLR